MDRAPTSFCIALLSGVAAFASGAHAEVFRCTSASGAVSYQELPCGAGETLRVVDVPAAYPAPNTAERDRLFQREAALDQRLEAQRERESREAIVRMSQPVPPQAEPQEPQFAWIYPPVMRPHFGRMGPRPRIAPFMR